MSRNTRIFRFGPAPRSSESTAGQGLKSDTLAAMTVSILKVEHANREWVPGRHSTGTLGLIAGMIAMTFFASFSALAYSNLGGNVFGSNGTDSDTQAAINAAPAGGTVQIPNGTYTWATGITCNKAIKIAGASVGGVTINDNNTGGALVYLTPVSGASVELCNLIFQEGSAQGNKSNQHMLTVGYAPGATPVLLHDCSFFSNGHMLSQVLWSQNGGVIWNCTFDANFTSDESLQFKISSVDTWKTPSTMGTADANGTANTYIENCTFQHSYYETIDLDDGSRTVFRYNTMNNTIVVSHGQDSSPYGNRHWEFYNNTFIWTIGGNIPNPAANQSPLNLQGFLLLRGGTGIIANNVLPDVTSQAWGNKGSVQFACFSITQYDCFTQYPIPRQVGQSWSGGSGSYSYPQDSGDGSGYITDPVYIWGNTGGTAYNSPGTWDFTPDNCGNGLTSADVIKSGRDYKVNTAKPGYAPYTYPHPLRKGAQAVPLAPTNLRVTS
jgi:hypothetical protein